MLTRLRPKAPLCRAWNAALSAARAWGPRFLSSSHMASVRARSSGRGTTSLTSPRASAFFALYLRLRYQISRARLRPTESSKPGAEARVVGAHHGPDLAEGCLLARHREVAHVGEHVAATHREAVDHGDDRHGHEIDEAVQVHHGRHVVIVELPVVGLLLPANAEEAIARPRE